MLAEFLNRIVELAHAGKRAEFLTHGSLPDMVYLLNADGTVDEQDVPPPKRQGELLTRGDVVAVCTEDKDMAPNPEVWVDKNNVDVILDRQSRREVLHCPLIHTEQFMTLVRMATPMQMEPRAAIKLLRFDLHGANSEGIVQALSRVDFLRTSEGTSTVEHGKESLGRSVEAAVQQADDIPERFTVTVPIWAGFTYDATVQCGVYLDLETQRVELRVLADEINRVLTLNILQLAADLRELMVDHVVHVYTGTVR